MFMTNFIGRLWKKEAKWHEVEWRDEGRTIWMALSFASDSLAGDSPTPGATPAKPPVLEVMPGEGSGFATVTDGDETIAQVQSAVAEYNKMNLCALRVVGIRRHASPDATPADYRTATLKLLNLL